ncbi:MAG: ROK family protein [Chitinophagaceae bacterium]|nr:ROK family protein [Chitinophagaceae bacterium]
MNFLWGIDLGGTKIEGVIIKEINEKPEVVCRMRVSTEAEKGYEHIIHQIYTLVDNLKKESGLIPSKIGIGTPGTLEPSTQTLKNSNTTCLNGKFLKKDIESALHLPIEIANDANCFAIAETLWGCVPEKVSKAEVVFGIIMGTGVGGGLVMFQKVPTGKHGIAGEWGHNFLDISGGNCYCGKVGCVERILSGPSLEKFYHSLSGEKKKLPDIYKSYQRKDDAHSTATMERMIHYFGKAVAMVINIVDPDAIVIGGGVGNIDLLYSEGVMEVKKYIFNPTLETPFLKPKLGDSAGVFGAALLTKDT